MRANSIEKYLKIIRSFKRNHLKRSKLNGYVCIEDFILKNGRNFKTVRAENYRKTKECYKNSFLFCDRYENEKTPRYFYCDGYALNPKVPDFPLEHSWVWDSKMKCAVEVTWKECGTEYFGVIIKHDCVRNILLETKVFGDILFQIIKLDKKQWKPQN